MKTKRLVVNALCVALYVALSAVSIPLPGIKITLDALPIILAAILYGPVDGLIVGLMGNFLAAALGLGYGLSATTPLWMLPPGLRGLLVGLAARRRFSLAPLPLGTLMVATALVTTAVTTAVMWLDCLVYHYSFLVTYLPNIPARILAGIATALVYTFLLPPLLRALGYQKQEDSHANHGH